MITIDIDGLTIEVQRKKMKNMTLRVCAPHGNIKISAPLRSSQTAIRRFAITHIEWIKKQQLEYSHSRQAYETGERHFLQGREYILRVHEGIKKTESLISDESYLNLCVPSGASEEDRKKLLTKIYRQLLIAQVEELIPYWENKIGVNIDQYQIRFMKSRWGSCTPQKRKICLNLALIKYPTICLEYVIVHELVHFLEPSHNARFKGFMDKFLPDWRSYRTILNTVS